MWILQCKANPDVKHYILVGKDYVVGRKDVDIVVPDDMSVSRNHCTLSVTHSERHLMNPSQVPALNIQEKSKFGTILQGVQIRGQQKKLNDGDIIKFGTQQSEYQVIYEPWIITTSCLENTRKRALRTKVLQLGGHMVNEWQRGCSLLVMSNISVTIKVICALVCKRPIVTPHYIDDYIEAIQQKKPVPDHTGYIPDLVESQLDPSNVSFKPMAARSDIFQGKIFVFLAEKQFKKMQLALEMGGAMTLLMDEAGDDEMITQRETCVMQCQRQDTKSPEWYDTVVSLLEKNKRRMIPDAEIGYAVLHCCVEKYCNPEIQSDMFAWSRLPGIGKVYWPVKIVDSEGTSITVYSSSDDAYFTVKEANILEWGKHLSLLEKGKVMLRKKPNSLKAFLDDFEWILTQLEQSQPRDELSTHQSKNQQVESKLSETGTSSLPGSLTSVSQLSGIQHDERPLSGSQLSESPFSTCLQPVSFSLEGQSTNPQSKSLLPVSLYRNPQPESHALSPLPEIQIPLSPSIIHQTENQLCANQSVSVSDVTESRDREGSLYSPTNDNSDDSSSNGHDVDSRDELSTHQSKNQQLENEDQPGIPSQTLSQHQEVPETVLDETSHSQSQAAHSRHAQSASKIEGDSDSSYHTVNIKQEPISPKSQRQSHDTPKKRLRQDDTEVTQPASKAIKTEPGGTSQRKGKTQTLDSFFQRKPTSKKEGTEQQSRNLDASNSGTKRSQESLPADNKPVSSRTLRSQSRSPSPVPGNLDSLKSRRKSQSPAPEVKPRGKRSRAQRSPSPVPNVSQNSVRSRSQKSPSPVPDVSQRSVRSRSQKSPSPVPGENQSSGRSRSQRSPSPVPESPPMPVRKRARRTPSPAPPKVKIEPGCEEESDVKPGPSTSTTTHRPSIKQELPDPDEGSAAHGRPAPLPLTNGFLCTNRPAPCKRDPDLDQEELEGKINVESRSLMVRKPGAKNKQQITTGDDGYCTWQGKRIKNFKKFRKTSHVGADKLPYIIGGTDLVVHTAASSRDLDEFFAEQSQNISQQNEQQKLANDLFEWEPRTKKKGRR